MKQIKLYLLLVFCFISQFAFSANQGKIVKFQTDEKFIHDFCLSADNELIYSTDGNDIKIFSSTTFEKLGELKNGHSQKILTLALSKDGSMLASGGRDSIVNIWDLKTGSIIQKIDYSTGIITDIEFSPNGKKVLYGCSNSRTYLFEISSKKLLKEFT